MLYGASVAQIKIRQFLDLVIENVTSYEAETRYLPQQMPHTTHHSLTLGMFGTYFGDVMQQNRRNNPEAISQKYSTYFEVQTNPSISAEV